MHFNYVQNLTHSFPLQYLNHTNILTVLFKDELCCNDEIVGGKGASLAKLTSIKSTQVFFYHFIIMQ